MGSLGFKASDITPSIMFLGAIFGVTLATPVYQLDSLLCAAILAVPATAYMAHRDRPHTLSPRHPWKINAGSVAQFAPALHTPNSIKYLLGEIIFLTIVLSLNVLALNEILDFRATDQKSYVIVGRRIPRYCFCTQYLQFRALDIAPPLGGYVETANSITEYPEPPWRRLNVAIIPGQTRMMLTIHKGAFGIPWASNLTIGSMVE